MGMVWRRERSEGEGNFQWHWLLSLVLTRGIVSERLSVQSLDAKPSEGYKTALAGAVK